MPSQDITLLLYPVISSLGDLVHLNSSMFTIFKIKVDDVTIQNLIRRTELPKEELPSTTLCQIGTVVQIH